MKTRHNVGLPERLQSTPLRDRDPFCRRQHVGNVTMSSEKQGAT
jgi:hypothetical protein